jgi:hypothetical protein
MIKSIFNGHLIYLDDFFNSWFYTEDNEPITTKKKVNMVKEQKIMIK